MALTGTGMTQYSVTLAAAAAAGSQVTFTHNTGQKAIQVLVSNSVTGKDLDGITEIFINQPNANQIVVANQMAVPVTVIIFARFRVFSPALEELLPTDPRLSTQAGPVAPPGGEVTGSGAAGQVTFWTGIASISGDNGLFWDNVTKRLGIGTITPTEGVVDIRGAAGSSTRFLWVGPTEASFSPQAIADLFAFTPSNMFTGLNVPGTSPSPLNVISEVTTTAGRGALDIPIAFAAAGASSHAAGTFDQMFGAALYTYHMGAGSIGNSWGASGVAYNVGGGSISKASGFTGAAFNLGAGTMAEGSGLRAIPNNNSGGGVITDNAGLILDDQTGIGTNNYQLWSKTVSPVVIRSDGFVGIGSTVPNTAFDLAVGSLATRAVTPATFAVTQNDYDVGVGEFFRVAATAAAQSITGLANGVDGRHMILSNVGANDITIADQNAGSVAGNRIITGTGADLTLVVNASITLIYDATTTRWRIIA